MKNKHVLSLLFAAFVCTMAAAQQVMPATSFGNNGTFQQTVMEDDVNASDPIIQPDGKLLIEVSAGDESDYHTNQFIYRITPTGELDPGFANNGILQVGLLFHLKYYYGIIRNTYFDLQPDGKIVVINHLLDRFSNMPGKISIERYMPDGKPDSSFGTNGVNAFPDYATSTSLKIKPNGKILVTGFAYNAESGNYTPVIAQFNSNGHIDRSFGDSGVLQSTSPYEQNIYGLQVLPNNQFVTIGPFTIGNLSGTCETIHKADGSIDSTKGTNGVVINGYIQQPTSVLGIALQNNKLLVYTSIQKSDSMAAVLFRYKADGTLDNSFGDNGMATAFTYQTGPVYSQLTKVGVQDNGKIIVRNLQGQLLRFNADGSRDYSFGTNGVLNNLLVDKPIPFALNHNRLYIAGAEYGADFPQVIVNAYDFCYTCATAEKNNSLTAQLKTPGVLTSTAALQFYPNPVKDKLTITGLPAAAVTILQLTDANGRVVQRATTQSATFGWNVQSLMPGVYYLNIIKDKTLPVAYKVIKE